MKNTIRNSVGIIALFLLLTNGILAQDYLKMSGSRIFQFKAESSPSVALVNVTSEYNYLKIHVMGYVEMGNIFCELIDPAGEVKQTFNIVSDNEVIKGENTGYSSIVKGEMEKAFRNPAQGKWQVRVVPNSAQGHIEVEHVLISHPKADVMELDQIEQDTRSTGK